MIPCQRHLFDIPEEVAYLNCAFTSPLLNKARADLEQAARAKANPWTLAPPDFFEVLERNRQLFARLTGCSPDDVAIVPAVSNGIAVAARNLSVGPGKAVLTLADQFPSHVYSWRKLAARSGGTMLTVQRPADHDWTRAVLERLDERVAVAALPQCHWTNGGLLDLAAIGERCRAVGAALVVDAIQSLGAMPLSIPRVRPDYLAAASHKWLLGAYGYGFLYVSPERQGGEPLEENWLNRAGSEDFSRLVDYREGYQPGARRFDMGEASSFLQAPVARAGLEQILDWGVEEIAATLARFTGRIADEAAELGFTAAPAHLRGPHMVGIKAPSPKLLEGLPARLAQDKVFVSVRGDSIRVAPHLYNTPQDVDRLLAALRKL